jgi:hypothetical protein
MPGLSELTERFRIAASVLRVKQERHLSNDQVRESLWLTAELTYYDIFDLAIVTLQDCRMLP